MSSHLGWDALYVDDLGAATPSYTTPSDVRFSNGSNSSGVGLHINRNVGDLYGSMGTRVWDANGDIGAGGVLMGTSIQNDTGSDITSFSLGYVGEHWWVRSGDPGTFEVSFSTNATSLQQGSGDWNDINELTYTTQRTGTSINLNGRTTEREDQREVFRPVTIELDTPLADGESMWIRWFSVNQPGIDQSIGFDEIRFTANPGASPFNTNLTIGTDADPTGLNWQHADRIIDLGAGSGATGNLTVAAGQTLEFYDLYLGVDASDASGTLVVDGAGASATLTRDTGFSGLVHVGVDGSGEIEVTNGGSFEGNFLRVARNEDSTGSVIVSENGSFVNADSSIRFGEASGAQGDLTITSGGTFTNDGDWIRFASAEGSSSDILVDGGTFINNGGFMHIGSEGDASLTIQNGGIWTNSSSQHVGRETTSDSSMLVSGDGSQASTGSFLYIGNEGTGSLTVEDGALVEVGSDLRFGVADTGSGTGLVTGEGSRVEVGLFLHVGSEGAGSLTISDGAHLETGTESSNAGISVAASTGSEGSEFIVTGENTTVLSRNFLRVGRSDDGSMQISDGATVTVESDIRVGEAGSTASLSVSGTNTTLSSDEVIDLGNGVGSNSAGTLNISDGASVSSGGEVNLGRNSSTTGTVNISGGDSQLSADDTITVGRFGDGFLNVTTGGEVSAGANLIVADSGDGSVLVNGSGTTIAVSNDLLMGASGDAIGGFTGTGSMASVEIGNDGVVNVSGDSAIRGASTLHINGGDLNTGIFDAADSASTVLFTLAANGETGAIFASDADVSGANLELILGHQPNLFDVFVLLNLDDPNASINGLFSFDGTPINEGDLLTVSTGSFEQEFAATYLHNGNNFALTAIPEPRSASLLAAFLGFILLIRRRS